MPKQKSYKYFTEVSGQSGSYTVKHLSKVDLQTYEKKLAEQFPYFRKVKSGKLT